jgi:lipoprotein-releasing system permease protein
MDWRFFVASRYFKIRRKEKFVSTITLISILGVAVGVAALIIVLAVMSGFDNELKTRIVGTTSHIFIERDSGIIYPDEYVAEVLSQNNDVVNSSPFVSGQVILRSGERFGGAILNGLDDVTEKEVTNFEQYLIKGGSHSLKEKGLFVGSELAKELSLKIGDSVSIISANSEKPYDFVITGIFRTGLYTFDVNNVLVSLKSAQRVFNIDKYVSGIGVKIADELKANQVKKELARGLGFPYFVRSWMDLNENLFSALKLEKITMFIILTLIVIVACFNIASTLIVRVVEKTKDIGILKALGATNRDIGTIFRLEGLFIGIFGTILGVGLGLCISWAQKTYDIVKLPREIYYIDALPVYISWHDSLVIAVCAVLLSWVATIYPSHKAARLKVVDALRYE